MSAQAGVEVQHATQQTVQVGRLSGWPRRLLLLLSLQRVLVIHIQVVEGVVLAVVVVRVVEGAAVVVVLVFERKRWCLVDSMLYVTISDIGLDLYFLSVSFLCLESICNPVG